MYYQQKSVEALLIVARHRPTFAICMSRFAYDIFLEAIAPT